MNRTLFPGAMGPDGFISCFDHLLDEAHLKRKLILKGGPGVGKSTFMRRVHAALCPENEAATLYFCSGDPDSLDAVAVPHAGLLILDGTAPHIVDPEIPGARDSIINHGVRAHVWLLPLRWQGITPLFCVPPQTMRAWLV